MLAAGIMNAIGLVTAVDSDSNNVFITLTAKGLRPDIFVMDASDSLIGIPAGPAFTRASNAKPKSATRHLPVDPVNRLIVLYL